MKYNNNKCDKTQEKRRRRKEQAKIHLTMKEKDQKISSRLILLKYAKEKNQEDEWLSNREWNLYPPEEEKRVTFARMLSFKDENIPCALVKVGGGKVRLIHTVVFAPMKSSMLLMHVIRVDGTFKRGKKVRVDQWMFLNLTLIFLNQKRSCSTTISRRIRWSLRSIWDLNLPLTENRLITQLVVTKKDQEEQKIFQTTTGQHLTCLIWNMNEDSTVLDQG